MSAWVSAIPASTLSCHPAARACWGLIATLRQPQRPRRWTRCCSQPRPPRRRQARLPPAAPGRPAAASRLPLPVMLRVVPVAVSAYMAALLVSARLAALPCADSESTTRMRLAPKNRRPAAGCSNRSALSPACARKCGGRPARAAPEPPPPCVRPRHGCDAMLRRRFRGAAAGGRRGHDGRLRPARRCCAARRGPPGPETRTTARLLGVWAVLAVRRRCARGHGQQCTGPNPVDRTANTVRQSDDVCNINHVVLRLSRGISPWMPPMCIVCHVHRCTMFVVACQVASRSACRRGWCPEEAHVDTQAKKVTSESLASLISTSHPAAHERLP